MELAPLTKVILLIPLVVAGLFLVVSALSSVSSGVSECLFERDTTERQCGDGTSRN